ncbi:uncharacterized protein A1O5_07295 [Cladophialophora psammophila CBS 110553]|uniref:Uncharacterized protein n=1 Tax=Cladophialophora psammophila CBS 110553 TaxID=1182543 RepID=W9XFU6_9EURO|nr:uncharacterized protein A1O5_07295 [Cladophialophora psammophila CBS 110553]EXJ69259.1 hypothetical protein A1O5_07295 [Cladophialophora psammophila CBS 110553]
MTRRWIFASQDKSSRTTLLTALFSDDDLCRTFGFNQCVEEFEVANLFCIYGNLVQSFGSVSLQLYVNEQTLGEFIQSWISASHVHRPGDDRDCPCFPWFLSRRLTGFDIPHQEGSYAYQVCAMIDLERYFSPGSGLSHSEKSVASLYSVLLRDFNNIPDASTAEWILFGFCNCTNTWHREALAAAYLELAKNETPLDQIAKAWETSSLQHLMKSQGIDISLLDADIDYFQQPSVDEVGIYRLMAEVKHALSGSYCLCFRPACKFHSKYETLLSKESEGDYGFHGANTWERWQLLNFYSHVFSHPDFDARKMQEAKRNPNLEALEEYLDSLVPKFRRQIGNEFLADAMFPKLKDRVTFPHGRPPCECIIHTTLTSEGLDFRSLRRISWMRGMLKDDENGASDIEREEG